MPVKVIHHGSTYSETAANAFELSPGNKLTIIAEYLLTTKNLEAKGITVYTLVGSEKSCTNLDVGRIDVREAIKRYAEVKQ